MCTRVLNVRLWILVRRARSTLVGHFTLGSHLFSQDTFLSSHHVRVHPHLYDTLADRVGDQYHHVGLGLGGWVLKVYFRTDPKIQLSIKIPILVSQHTLFRNWAPS